MKIERKFRLRFGNRILAFKFLMWNSKVFDHTGISNQCNDGYYIPFWDFANLSPPIPLALIASALKEAQEMFELSDIYIIQTKPRPSYRAFCLDKIPFQEAVTILGYTRFIDINYLRTLASRGRAIIRISQKPDTKNEIVAVLKGRGRREISTHHMVFLAKLYGFSTKMYGFPIKITLSRYESLR